MNIDSVSAIIVFAGTFQLIIGIILAIIFVFLPKRRDNLSLLGSIFVGSGIVQIGFGVLLWVVNSYVN